METWPAHATGHAGSSSSIALTKDKKLRQADEESTAQGNMVPKPKFLDALENFLKKELKALGVSQVMPSELRLQVGVIIKMQVNMNFSFLAINIKVWISIDFNGGKNSI